MDIATLIVAFLAALAVSGCVVLAFSSAINGVILRLISGEVAAAWARFVKFALFVASFAGGLRLHELETLSGLTSFSNGQSQINMGECLLEMYKTIAGGLIAASWALLAFFGTTLCVYAAMRLQGTSRPQEPSRPIERQHGSASGRL